MACDLDEFMIEENIEKAYIIGHSMGGKTAMLFSALHPNKILGLIVVDIYPGDYAALPEFSPHIIAHLKIATSMLSVNLNNFNKRSEIENELAKTINDINVRQFIMKNLFRKPDNTFAWRLNVPAISKAFPAIMGSIPLEGTQLSTFPVLFMRGEHSDYICPEQIAMIKKYYPEALIKTISDAGHWIHADNPEQFIEVLNKFLQCQN